MGWEEHICFSEVHLSESGLSALVWPIISCVSLEKVTELSTQASFFYSRLDRRPLVLDLKDISNPGDKCKSNYLNENEGNQFTFSLGSTFNKKQL